MIAIVSFCVCFLAATLMLGPDRNEDREEMGVYLLLLSLAGIATYLALRPAENHWGYGYLAIGFVGFIAGTILIHFLIPRLRKGKPVIEKTVGSWEPPPADDSKHLGI